MFKIEAVGIIDRMEDVRTWQGKNGRQGRARTITLYENQGKDPKSLDIVFMYADVDKLDGFRERDPVLVLAGAETRECTRRDGGTFRRTELRGFDIEMLTPDGERIPQDAQEPWDDGVTID